MREKDRHDADRNDQYREHDRKDTTADALIKSVY